MLLWLAKLHGFGIYALKVGVGTCSISLVDFGGCSTALMRLVGLGRGLTLACVQSIKLASRALGQLVGQLAHDICCLDAETHCKIFLS